MPRALPVPGSIPLAQAIDHRCLALLGVAPRPFKREGWAWEPKFDGYRALAFTHKAARILTRNGNDISVAFPDVLEALSAIRADVVLDGELTVADDRGRPDWNAVRRRAVMRSAKSITTEAIAPPATMYAFDVLAIDEHDIRPANLAARRATLLRLVEPSSNLRVPELWDDGRALFGAVVEHELEGVVAKRLDSPYCAGRCNTWLKVRAPTARPQERL